MYLLYLFIIFIVVVYYLLINFFMVFMSIYITKKSTKGAFQNGKKIDSVVCEKGKRKGEKKDFLI